MLARSRLQGPSTWSDLGRRGDSRHRGLGQLKAKVCPVCAGFNGGKWTCGHCTPLVNVHRELIRNLQHWKSLLVAHQVDEVLTAADRRSYCIWDVERFYQKRTALPERQRQSIELCLFDNYTEAVAAEKMGVSPTNPVAMYATVGLARLLSMAMSGEIPGYLIPQPPVKETVHDDAPSQWSSRPAGSDRRPVDQGITQGGDEALRQGRHPDPVEGAGASTARDLRAVGDAGLGESGGHLPSGDEPLLSSPELSGWGEDQSWLPTRRSASGGRGELDRSHHAGVDRPLLLVGQRMKETGELDLSVRFGRQVRYQCAAEGCRRYLRTADGHARCGNCGAKYLQCADGKFSLLVPQAVPA